MDEERELALKLAHDPHTAPDEVARRAEIYYDFLKNNGACVASEIRVTNAMAKAGINAILQCSSLPTGEVAARIYGAMEVVRIETAELLLATRGAPREKIRGLSDKEIGVLSPAGQGI